MHFLSNLLENYIANNSQAEPTLLTELTRETHLKVVQPRMITGHFQGRVLSMLSKLISPKYILEIGTYTGYSALCLAEGLQKDGELHTIEVNEELHQLQRKYFDKSAYGNQIVQHTGDALEVIPSLDFTFDLVFIDAQKVNYDAYFEAVIQKTKPGSVILSDNVLWSGKVVEPLDKSDKATAALLAYNEKLSRDPRAETVLLPIRDGLTLSRVL
ncbi:O-methyltransferase [Flagellimonas zhangzhouensis]|uniref:Predicted O-methyltransferase YrrM n=1 Tax=Flagellimonas zhangzhouensis TaxID=1073328 RepID=A0A1H2YV47_9FLAO|nr:O-methyltransferase [Allomuricauda zhangzhouensis]SDR05769.1 Predicted O-methyltransferase YrrM [Allomuricauda zhangzhouensis]SDX09050.1 Predicted O-methyltransferase YrrM [Allomuricauda zhangzhouensis]